LCFIKIELSVKVKLFVLLLCVCAILPAKAIPEMTYTVSGGTLNSTHSHTYYVICMQVQHYDARLLDPGGAGAAADEDIESVNLLRDDSHFTNRLSFGSASVAFSRFAAVP